MPRSAIFLDRDGVLNQRVRGYVLDPAELVVLPEAKLGLFLLRTLTPYLFVLFTNQSCVGRGRGSWAQVDAVNEALLQQLGITFSALYVCPHDPSWGCNCRKPAPGMLLSAIRDLNVDPFTSWVVGDRASDLQAGKLVGCSTLGIGEEPGLAQWADCQAPDLLTGAWTILWKTNVSGST